MLHKLFFLIHPPVQDCHFSAKNAKINLFENNWNVTKSRFGKKSVTLHQKLIINRLVKKSLVLKMEDFSSWWREVLFFSSSSFDPPCSTNLPITPPMHFCGQDLHSHMRNTCMCEWKSQERVYGSHKMRTVHEITRAVRTKYFILSEWNTTRTVPT